MNAHDLIQEIIERKGKVENVFWIACGGSMIDLMPANELLKREATTFTSTVYTAREFCLMAPKSLGPKSLVVACSHSGNTQEVVDGCEMALAAGAKVVASPTARAQRSTTASGPPGSIRGAKACHRPRCRRASAL